MRKDPCTENHRVSGLRSFLRHGQYRCQRRAPEVPIPADVSGEYRRVSREGKPLPAAVPRTYDGRDCLHEITSSTLILHGNGRCSEATEAGFRCDDQIHRWTHEISGIASLLEGSTDRFRFVPEDEDENDMDVLADGKRLQAVVHPPETGSAIVYEYEKSD